MRMKTLWLSVIVGLGLLVGSACTASADMAGTAGDAGDGGNAVVQAAGFADGGAQVMGKGGNGGGGGGGGGGTPPPAPDTGWLYYWTGGGADTLIHRQQADGSTNETVTGAPTDYGCTNPACGPGNGTTGRPSHATHDGSRWYLAAAFPSEDSVFPNAGGSGWVTEIDLVREGDTTGLRVSDNRTQCLNVAGYDGGGANLHWTPDASGNRDGAIAFAGSRWADLDGDPAGDCEAFVEAGIFRAAVATDANGAFVSMDAPALVAAMPLDANNQPDIAAFSWAPDGSSVAYVSPGTGTWGDGQIWVANAGSPVSGHTQVSADGNTNEIDWSSDLDTGTAGLQTRILFTRATTVRVKGQDRAKWLVESMLPDGTGRTTLASVQDGSSGPKHQLVSARWSPTGSHVAYADRVHSGGSSTQLDLYRITASGTDSTLLYSHTGESVFSRPLQAWTQVD